MSGSAGALLVTHVGGGSSDDAGGILVSLKS